MLNTHIANTFHECFFYHENCPNINILILFFAFTPTAVALMNSLWFQLSFILFTSILPFSLLYFSMLLYANTNIREHIPYIYLLEKQLKSGKITHKVLMVPYNFFSVIVSATSAFLIVNLI